MSNTNLKEVEMSTAEQSFEPAAMDQDADRQLKANHRALWASGDSPAVAAELIPTLDPSWCGPAGCGPGIAYWTSPRARAMLLS